LIENLKIVEKTRVNSINEIQKRKHRFIGTLFDPSSHPPLFDWGGEPGLRVVG